MDLAKLAVARFPDEGGGHLARLTTEGGQQLEIETGNQSILLDSLGCQREIG